MGNGGYREGNGRGTAKGFVRGMYGGINFWYRYKHKGIGSTKMFVVQLTL